MIALSVHSFSKANLQITKDIRLKIKQKVRRI